MKTKTLDIVMTGYAGLSAGKSLADENRSLLRRTLTDSFLDSMQAIPEECESLEVWESMEVEVARGGVLEALWNLAEMAGVGLNVDMEKIPIRQETIEVCEVLDVNPYQLPSGCHLYLTENGNTHPGRVIGQTNATKARTITGREGVRYLDKPRHKGDGIE